MARFILRILGNGLALYIASLTVPGFFIEAGWKQYLLAGLALALLNLTVKPVLKALSMPLIIITFGLFTIVINAAMIWIVDYLFNFLVIQDWAALLWVAIIAAIVNIFVGITIKKL